MLAAGFGINTVNQSNRLNFLRPHSSGAVATRTNITHRLTQARAESLAGHFQQAKLADIAHLCPCLIRPHSIAQGIDHGVFIAVNLHVDKVNDD